MAEDNTEIDDIMLHCAGCGVKEDDGIKLKKCTACYLVRYCGVYQIIAGLDLDWNTLPIRSSRDIKITYVL